MTGDDCNVDIKTMTAQSQNSIFKGFHSSTCRLMFFL